MSYFSLNSLKPFSLEHILTLIIIVILFGIYFLYSQKLKTEPKRTNFLIFLVTLLWTTQLLVYHHRFIYMPEQNKTIPFLTNASPTRYFVNPPQEKFLFGILDGHLCFFVILFVLLFSIFKLKIFYEFLLLVGPFSTIIALLVPNVNNNNYPSLEIFTYFITHATALLFVIFIFISYQTEYILNKKSVIKVIILLLSISLVNILINTIFKTNFMFLNGNIKGMDSPLNMFSLNPFLRLIEMFPIFLVVILFEYFIYKKILNKK